MSATYTLTFDGQSATLRRHIQVEYRRWFRTKQRTETFVMGVFQCPMGFDLQQSLNEGSVLRLKLGGDELVLADLAIIEGRA